MRGHQKVLTMSREGTRWAAIGGPFVRSRVPSWDMGCPFMGHGESEIQAR